MLVTLLIADAISLTKEIQVAIMDCNNNSEIFNTGIIEQKNSQYRYNWYRQY